MADTALMIDGIGVDFGGFKAVDGFSMIVEEGELRTLLGANGAGKTTLMDLISGKTKATEGHIYLYGEDVTNKLEHEIARAGIGRKFQIPSVFRHLTVEQNLEVAAIAVEARNVLRNLRNRMRRRDKLHEVLSLIGLAGRAGETAMYLSHGETQWLELGLLIIQNPKLILLDEPTAGMTQAETEKTSEIINELKGQHTLIVVEHDMAFVRRIAETITVMHMGKFLAQGSITAIENNPEVKAAYLGSGGIR